MSAITNRILDRELKKGSAELLILCPDDASAAEGLDALCRLRGAAALACAMKPIEGQRDVTIDLATW